ncbi:MAG: 3-dehydroquinate synthase [Deltaproteobacteria bacterium RBG_16_42_7]|nr:MAG: 3-dehydroquinate synthase [Deltaproteobacteria bacterium RBG_16_42_7]
MKEITLAGKTGAGVSRIMLGLPLSNLARFCSAEKTVVITDSNVLRLYGKDFSQFRTIVIEPGEEHKTLDTVREIYESLLRFEFDRSSFILGIGGGMVCDIAGYAASTYLRGLSFAFVPTTLLAQVDASVGGKNGVNFKKYKNLVGTFNQPEFVLCDFEVLKTLTQAEIKNGFAELIKHALIGNRSLFSRIERNAKAALALDKAIIEGLVYDSLKVKIGIVTQDEKEKGVRRKLNLGHTFGHALEKTAGLSHGEGVAIGMIMEIRLSQAQGLLQKKDVERIGRMFIHFGLPVSITGTPPPTSGYPGYPVAPSNSRATGASPSSEPCSLGGSLREAIMDAIKRDKKREGEYIHSILLEGIGRTRIEKIKINDIEEIVNDMC